MIKGSEYRVEYEYEPFFSSAAVENSRGRVVESRRRANKVAEGSKYSGEV